MKSAMPSCNSYSKIVRRVITGVLLQGLVTLAGCATQSVTLVQKPLEPTIQRTVRIEPCVDRSGFKGERDLAGDATRILTDKVRESKLFAVNNDGALVMTCDIERFAEGSALKRWVWPGWGATQAAVSVMVWEKPGDKVLATFRSQSSVSAGGLYTIGADKYILGTAFDDIIKQLKAWTPGTNSKEQGQPGKTEENK